MTDAREEKLFAPVLLLRVLQGIWLLISVISGSGFLFKSPRFEPVFLVLAIVCLLFAAGLQFTIKGLKRKMYWAWVVAVFFACTAVPSIMLPLALYVAIRLFKPEVVNQFKSQQVDDGYGASTNFINESYRLKMSALFSYAISITLIIGYLIVGVKNLNSQPRDNAVNVTESKTYVPKEMLTEQLSGMNNGELRNKSQECMKNEDKECLISIYSELVRREPGNITWSANLAFNLTDLGYHDQALPIYESIANDASATFDIMAYYGTSLQKIGDFDGSIVWYKKALAVNPKLVDVARDLAISLMKTGRDSEARQLIHRFVQAHPESEMYFRDVSSQLLSTEKVISL